eukprot:c21659_g4_i2.p1 GENE.c21659_g4_i2~~c21659_g4_i2.p1  ORF type:complete len:479 (+),score=221.09 c21659_g4_i2:35-1438(+)
MGVGENVPYSKAIEGALLFGTLEKRGKRMRGWVKREFVLRNDVVTGNNGEPQGILRSVLFYFKTKEDHEPAGKMNIHSGCSVIPKLIGEKQCFIISEGEDKEHIFHTPIKKLLSQWIITLEGLVQNPPENKKNNNEIQIQSTSPTIKEPVSRRTKNIEDFYYLHEKLGEGGFAVVKRGTDKEKGREAALKIIPTSTYKKAKARTDEEIIVLGACDHKHVVRLYEVVHTETSVVMALELLSGGELFDRIVAREKYTENDAKEVAVPILQAINYLHLHGIVHRDLKPENLIFDRPGEDATLKLTDFGFATILQSNRKLTGACGTPEYVAPEILNDESYDCAVDLWSCGVVIYILLCGFPPFYGETESEMFDKICAAQYSFPSPYWDLVSDEAKSIIESLLVLDPTKRLTAATALEHPWLKHTTESLSVDLSIALNEIKRYQATRKFRKAVIAILAYNKLKQVMAKHGIA